MSEREEWTGNCNNITNHERKLQFHWYLFSNLKQKHLRVTQEVVQLTDWAWPAALGQVLAAMFSTTSVNTMMALPHVAKRANGHATCIVKFVARMITSLLINALHWESRGQQGIAGEVRKYYFVNFVNFVNLFQTCTPRYDHWNLEVTFGFFTIPVNYLSM